VEESIEQSGEALIGALLFLQGVVDCTLHGDVLRRHAYTSTYVDIFVPFDSWDREIPDPQGLRSSLTSGSFAGAKPRILSCGA
jgi:hypothetical protein